MRAHFIYFGKEVAIWGMDVLPQKGNQFRLDYNEQKLTFCVDLVRFLEPGVIEVHVSQIVHLV